MNHAALRATIVTLLALLLALPLGAQNLKPFESSGKYGFVDELGKIVIPAQYDLVDYFKDGLAYVRQNGKSGFIDKTGKAVIPIVYDEVNDLTEGTNIREYFNNGLAIVLQDGKWGVVDKTGRTIIPVQYDELLPFENGLTTMQLKGKWGALDQSGKTVIPCKYDSQLCFTENMARALLNDKWGFIDKKGRMVIPATFESASGFAEGLALVRQNGKYGFIDTSGKFVVPAQFDEILDSTDYQDDGTYGTSYFPEGLAIVIQNGKCGFIDKEGKMVIPARFDYADSFSNGIAMVRLNDKDGIIDKTGKFIIPAVYDRIGQFSEGLAPMAQDGKWGFIDKNGKIIIAPQFDNADSFSEGLAEVEQNGKSGYIDKGGNIVIPIQFDNACPFFEGLASVSINGKWGSIDKTGKIVITPQFDDWYSFNEGLAFVEQSDNLYGTFFFIDQQGRRYSTWEEGKDYLAKEAAKTPFQAHNTRIQSTVQAVPDTGYADRMVDVDSDIPQAKGANFGTYAVVIANENYRSVADVGNAANDGNVLHQYLTKTLGIPENNVIYCENASAAMMDEALTTLETKTRSAAALGKAFNVIFYYSGHGVPAEGTSDAYLLPVDVSPKNLKRYGFSLDELYRRLGALEAQCVTVLLDACFSGAGRTGAMLADVKGVALEPKKAAPTGNMVVLSACSGSQTAHIFKEGKHGLFTYWLLRKLKETKGEVTLGELQEHLAQYVDYTATNRLNLPGQQPTLQVSPTLSRNWRAIPLR